MSLVSSSTTIFEIYKQRTISRKCNLSIGSLCLGSMCIGLTLGWPPLSLSYFIMSHCDETCKNSLLNSSGTIDIMMNFGSCIGALVPSCIADTYGRKSSFAVAGVLNLTFWAILTSIHGYLEIIGCAIIDGFAGGVFVSTTALYVSEISLPHTRAVTGALATFSTYLGVLFGCCLIFITFDRIIALIMTCLAIFFLVLLRCCMVESPYFLFLQGKTLEAKLSLKALRGAKSVLEIDPEYRTIEFFFNMRQHDRTMKKGKDCCFLMSMSRKRRHATFVILFLCTTQMVGAYGMQDYIKSFMDTMLPANCGHILISLLDVCSVGICLCVFEKFGRKLSFLVISTVGSSLSCLILAIFILADKKTNNYHKYLDSSILLPAISFALYYMIYSLGRTPIIPILTGEIFPSRYKTIALSTCISFIYLLSMIIQFSFEVLIIERGPNLAFALFAIFGSLGVPVVFTFLLNTHSNTLHEMQNDFEDVTIV